MLRAECYNGLQDAIGIGVEEDAQRLRCQIIIPSPIPGTPRYMKQLYQDAMAIWLFVDIMADQISLSHSPVIRNGMRLIISNIPAGSNATDHPDIVS